MRRGDYGYDAPYAPVMFGLVSLLAAAVSVIGVWQHDRRFAVRMAMLSALFLGQMLSFLYTTRRGKFIEWERILDGLHLRGDEQVLDMGCGRGAVLTAVARRLTTGQVTGVDIWNSRDQSGNARDVTVRNAAIEGVRDRVRVETSDMRALPFPDQSFDLVVSSLAIHNIRGKDGRRQAVTEAYRVLKPGGRLAFADIKAVSNYASTLRALGAVAPTTRRLGWRFWWGNPLAATRLLTASKD